MYVCVCNAVTDRQIREAVERGCDSMAKLRNDLKVATCCGKCESCARQVLGESLGEAACGWTLLPAAT
jgi:bacterioferritin-associated ferredoxin